MTRPPFAPMALLALAFVLSGCALLAPARLDVTPTTAVIDTGAGWATFVVANGGAEGSLLRWRFASDDLEAWPASGTLAAGASIEVDVFVTEPVAGASYQGRFVAGREEVTVRVTVLGDPAFACDPDTAFGASVAPTTARLLVGYDDGALARAGRADLGAATARVAAAVGGLVTRRGAGRGFDVVEVPVGAAEAALAALAATPGVRYAELDAPVHRRAAPADQYYAGQWNLALFGAELAWAAVDALTPTPEAVVLAVVDDGVAVDHPDLAGRVLQGVDVVGADLDVRNCTDHGTHVAGIAGADREPAGLPLTGTGVAGTASVPWVRVLPVKAWADTTDDEATTSVSFIVDGMRWAAGEDVPGLPTNPTPADVVNLSLGTSVGSTALADAVADLTAAGVVVVAAAGNAGTSAGVDFPARYAGAIAVGSVDDDFGRSAFSTYGTGLDLMAPGGFGTNVVCAGGTLVSTGVAYAAGVATETWTCKAGTSMATPFVAGAAALLIGADDAVRAASGAARVAAVTDRLLAAAALGPGGPTAEYGAGVLCLDALLTDTHVCGDPVAP